MARPIDNSVSVADVLAAIGHGLKKRGVPIANRVGNFGRDVVLGTEDTVRHAIAHPDDVTAFVEGLARDAGQTTEQAAKTARDPATLKAILKSVQDMGGGVADNFSAAASDIGATGDSNLVREAAFKNMGDAVLEYGSLPAKMVAQPFIDAPAQWQGGVDALADSKNFRSNYHFRDADRAYDDAGENLTSSLGSGGLAALNLTGIGEEGVALKTGLENAASYSRLFGSVKRAKEGVKLAQANGVADPKVADVLDALIAKDKQSKTLEAVKAADGTFSVPKATPIRDYAVKQGALGAGAGTVLGGITGITTAPKDATPEEIFKNMAKDAVIGAAGAGTMGTVLGATGAKAGPIFTKLAEGKPIATAAVNSAAEFPTGMALGKITGGASGATYGALSSDDGDTDPTLADRLRRAALWGVGGYGVGGLTGGAAASGRRFVSEMGSKDALRSGAAADVIAKAAGPRAAEPTLKRINLPSPFLGSVDAHINPTIADVRRMVKNARGSENPSIRWGVDKNGDVVFWDGEKAAYHGLIEDGLGAGAFVDHGTIEHALELPGTFNRIDKALGRSAYGGVRSFQPSPSAVFSGIGRISKADEKPLIDLTPERIGTNRFEPKRPEPGTRGWQAGSNRQEVQAENDKIAEAYGDWIKKHPPQDVRPGTKGSEGSLANFAASLGLTKNKVQGVLARRGALNSAPKQEGKWSLSDAPTPSAAPVIDDAAAAAAKRVGISPERYAQLSARAKQAGAGVDPDDVLTWAANMGYLTAVGTAAAVGSGALATDDANAEEYDPYAPPEDVNNSPLADAHRLRQAKRARAMSDRGATPEQIAAALNRESAASDAYYPAIKPAEVQALVAMPQKGGDENLPVDLAAVLAAVVGSKLGGKYAGKLVGTEERTALRTAVGATKKTKPVDDAFRVGGSTLGGGAGAAAATATGEALDGETPDPNTVLRNFTLGMGLGAGIDRAPAMKNAGKSYIDDTAKSGGISSMAHYGQPPPVLQSGNLQQIDDFMAKVRANQLVNPPPNVRYDTQAGRFVPGPAPTPVLPKPQPGVSPEDLVKKLNKPKPPKAPPAVTEGASPEMQKLAEYGVRFKDMKSVATKLGIALPPKATTNDAIKAIRDELEGNPNGARAKEFKRLYPGIAAAIASGEALHYANENEDAELAR
jgi:hypothetical protein